MDASNHHYTAKEELVSLGTPLHEDLHPKQGPYRSPTDWLALLPPEVETRRRRHTDISQDLRYKIPPPTGDLECIEAPDRIPDLILHHETHEALFWAGHGIAPDLIYARGVPNNPSPDPNALDRKTCNLILIEIRFCQDFGCQKRLQEKTAKYAPLVAE